MSQLGEAVDGKFFFHPEEIIVEQLFKHLKVMSHKVVDRSVLSPHLFTDEAERILVRDQQEGQVIMP